MVEANPHQLDIKQRAIASNTTMLVSSPPGFGKVELLRGISAAWPHQSKVQFFDAWDHSNDPMVAARAIAKCGQDALIVVADAHAANAAALNQALQHHANRKHPGKVVIGLDTIQAQSSSASIGRGECEIVDSTLLKVDGVTRQALLSSIGLKSDRDRVEYLAGDWPLALEWLVAQVQKSSERYRDALEGDLLHDAGLYDFVAQQIMAELPELERNILWQSCLLESCERDILRGIGQSETVMVNLCQRLNGLIERDGERFIVNPTLRKCALEFGALTDPQGFQSSLILLADHCSKAGHLVEASRLVCKAGEPNKIVQYAHDHNGLVIWLTAGYPALKAMVDYAGEQVVQQSPLLRLFECIIDLKSGRLRQAEQRLSALMGDADIMHGMQEQIEVTRMTLLIYGCTLKRAKETEMVSKLIAQPGGNPDWRTYLSTVGCVIRAQQARFPEARALVQEARNEASARGLTYNLMFLHLHEAGIDLAQGQIAKAKAGLKRAEKQWRHGFAEDISAGTVIAALSASIDYDSGKLTNARAALRRSKVMEPEAEAWFDIYFAAYDALARTFAKERSVSEVLGLLEEEQTKLREKHLSRVAELVRGIAQNVAGDAMLFSDAQVVGPFSDPLPSIESGATWQEREVATLATAHKMRLDGDVSEALSLLLKAKDKALGQNLIRSALRYELLRFALLHKMGSWDASLKALRWCLAIAAQTGMVQIFRDYTAFAFARYREDLLRNYDLSLEEQAMLAMPRPANDTGSGKDLNQLSERELEILSALASGGTDKELARQFGISDNGVRYHLRNIFRKLQVHDRLSAVVAAQREGLLKRA